MPPVDKRLAPDLETARPGDFDGCKTWVVWRQPWTAALPSHGEQRNVTVTAWYEHPGGRWIAHVEWSAEGCLWTETYFADWTRLKPRWQLTGPYWLA